MSSIRPFREILRRKTKKIKVGNVYVGGDAPISVQSMTNTLTTDAKATILQVNQIAEAGADIVRVSCPDEESTKALKEIVKHANAPIVIKEQLKQQKQGLVVLELIQEILVQKIE
jgi:(E)-4-hydroxy-3-methylbut-2-enyl-diphosphate synthase